jgi:hypothetical protein
MTNGEHFDAAYDILAPLAPDTAHDLLAKRERILTGFGATKSAERTTKTGVNYGSASAAKAAKWAGIEIHAADAFASAWNLAESLRVLGSIRK